MLRRNVGGVRRQPRHAIPSNQEEAEAMRKVLAALFLVLIVAAPTWAQDDRKVGVNFGAGWAFPTSGFKDSFNTGWNGGLGLTFNVKPGIGIQAEYMYDWMGGPDRTIGLSPTPVAVGTGSGILESNHHMHTGTFNIVYTPMAATQRDRLIGGYLLAGPGVYHRTVQITSPSVGYTTFCDPYWYVCYPTLVEVDRIVGDRSSTDFGMNFGGGITFGHDAKFYVEMRYHYVWGPDVSKVNPLSTEPTTSSSTSASYFPLTFGFRW
jgi:hypothetical protein